MKIDPERDLVLDRLLKAPPRLVWRCWTEPALFRQWYAPKPWVVEAAELEIRAGGRFYMLWANPDGQRFPNEGAFLEAVPEKKLVFTDLMTQDYAPVDAVSPDFGPAFTAVMTFAPEGQGTRYRSVARHRSAADARANREMGFLDGWAVTSDQLDHLAQELMA